MALVNGSFLHYTDMKKFLKNLLLRNCWSDFEIISQECVVLFKNCSQNLIPSKTLVAMATKRNSLKIFFSETAGPIFSSTGCRPASLCHGPLSVRPYVLASVRALTFSLNIFFSETTFWILMKFLRNVPTMVLFRIS